MLLSSHSEFDPRNNDPARFVSAVESLGYSAAAARQLMARVVGGGVFSHRELMRRHRVSRALCNTMGELPRLQLIDVVTSATDRFCKLAFLTHDELVIETVLIPLHKPGAVSVCLSSQVGCPMGCTFCATARMTNRRNLATWEIVDQFIQARDRVRGEGRRVTGAVFMGMGEPFLNYDRVLAAAEVISAPFGAAISGPAITVSTVGLVPEIDRFTSERRRFRLSISLGAATDEKRRQVVPIAAETPVIEVMAAARRHIKSRGQGRVMLSYVCIHDFNCGFDDAQALGRLVGDTPVRLDLIEVTDPTGRFQAPSSDELQRFRDALTRYVGQPVVRRYSGGKDISAACGTLAGTKRFAFSSHE